MDLIHSDFPILSRKVIYLDNASTTQKPRVVIEALKEFYENYNSNIHRGVYNLSEQATELYEKAKEEVARYLNADPSQIAFVKNATEALNIAIYNFKNKEIASTIYEHHSVLLPIYKYSKSYKLYDKIDEIKADNIVVTHASNVTGKVFNIKEIRDNNPEAKIIVDGTQYTPHFRPDLAKLDIDMYAFSAHKMLGPTGLGVLYVKEPKLYDPLVLGGGIVSNVSSSNYKLLETIERYEAGTPPIAEAYAFSSSINYLVDKLDYINKLDKAIIAKAYELFEEYNIYPINLNHDIPIFSFYFEKVHSHDIAEMLDIMYNIAIRSGFHCAQPLHEYYGVGATARASFYIYNNLNELELLMKGLKTILKKFS